LHRRQERQRPRRHADRLRSREGRLAIHGQRRGRRGDRELTTPRT
jgi:hypothetical protein